LIFFKLAFFATQTLHFAKIFTFFAFSLENIWSYQKKVVILHAFSPRNGLMRSRVYRKKGNFEAISKGTFINKNQLNKTTKCLQFNN